MNISDMEKTIVKKVNKNDVGILKFLDNTQISMTILNSIILLAIFFIGTVLMLTLISNEL